jgi:hypothetical protein
MQRVPKNLENLHSVLALAAVGEHALLTRHALLGARDLGEADMARAEGWASGPEQRQRKRERKLGAADHVRHVEAELVHARVARGGRAEDIDADEGIGPPGTTSQHSPVL